MNDRSIQMAETIAAKVRTQGGRCYYVGGFVRDRILGLENKDVDIEVHGIAPQTLEQILSALGDCISMGASFGVFGLKGYDIDIAMPRKETVKGRGHRDFDIFVDPYLGEEAAARRRDFTVNAMMLDVLTGELRDYYGGKRDAERKCLRHVNDVSFAEDPLRVLRGAQFAARFGFEIAEETRRLCASMPLEFLARERVMAELSKALLKAEKPSVFFEELRGMGQLTVWFPEVEALINVPQSPIHHPEGDVWAHTMLVLDEAAKLRTEAAKPLYFMLSALCHDFGKASTTEFINGAYHAYEHEIKGQDAVRRFIKRLTDEQDMMEYVLNMTRLHMRPNILIERSSAPKKWNRMFDDSISPNDLLLLAEADYKGCGNASDYAPLRICGRERLREFEELMQRPYVMGRDLIDAGLKPGKDFTEILAYAHKLRLAGMDKRSALRQTLAEAKRIRNTEAQRGEK